MPEADSGDDEFALIREYFAGLDTGAAVAHGNGDDAALLRVPDGEVLAVSVDLMVEGVHFPHSAPADASAFRAVAAAVSDLAAMAAVPIGMTLALTLPEAQPDWLRQCRRGLADASERFSLPLVGGDLSRGPLSLAVQVMGRVPAGQALRRDRARPGDQLCVSGTLGDSAAGLALLTGELTTDKETTDYLLRRYWRPTPRLELGVQLRALATAAIDVSDGLLADAGHLAAASGVQVVIEGDRLPLSGELLSALGSQRGRELALAGGEDFELCFTIPAQAAPPTGTTVIGSVGSGTGVHCDVQVDRHGYRHF